MMIKKSRAPGGAPLYLCSLKLFIIRMFSLKLSCSTYFKITGQTSCCSGNLIFWEYKLFAKHSSIGVATGGPYWAMALPKISIMGVAVVINWSLIIAITTTRTPTETIVEILGLSLLHHDQEQL